MLSNLFRNLPPITLNLILINVLMFIGTQVFPQLRDEMMLYYFENSNFMPYQILTHLFIHADFMHLLFNMITLVFFGSVIERTFGAKKMLIVYFLSGLGASILPALINYVEFSGVLADIELYKSTRADEYFYSFLNENYYPESELYTFEFNQAVNDFVAKMQKGTPYSNSELILEKIYQSKINIASLGASGCVMGLLAAFGYLYPNREISLLFPPISIPAKIYIPIIIYLELMMGVANFQMDNVGHWAHIGGAIIGLIMAVIWKKNRDNFY